MEARTLTPVKLFQDRPKTGYRWPSEIPVKWLALFGKISLAKMERILRERGQWDWKVMDLGPVARHSYCAQIVTVRGIRDGDEVRINPEGYPEFWLAFGVRIDDIGIIAPDKVMVSVSNRSDINWLGALVSFPWRPKQRSVHEELK